MPPRPPTMSGPIIRERMSYACGRNAWLIVGTNTHDRDEGWKNILGIRKWRITRPPSRIIEIDGRRKKGEGSRLYRTFNTWRGWRYGSAADGRTLATRIGVTWRTGRKTINRIRMLNTVLTVRKVPRKFHDYLDSIFIFFSVFNTMCDVHHAIIDLQTGCACNIVF